MHYLLPFASPRKLGWVGAFRLQSGQGASQRGHMPSRLHHNIVSKRGRLRASDKRQPGDTK
jgi:hypothetical protein